jgi:hypothetical protein
MSDENKGPPKTVSLNKKLKAVVAEVVFTPDDWMLMAKSKFWRRHAENPMFDADNVQLTQVVRITKCSKLSRFWGNEQFRDWFLDKDYVSHGLKALAEKAIRVLNELLDDPKCPHQAKVRAIEQIFEFGDYKPPVRREVKWADAELAKWNKEELDGFIQQQLAEAGYKKS